MIRASLAEWSRSLSNDHLSITAVGLSSLRIKYFHVTKISSYLTERQRFHPGARYWLKRNPLRGTRGIPPPWLWTSPKLPNLLSASFNPNIPNRIMEKWVASMAKNVTLTGLKTHSCDGRDHESVFLTTQLQRPLIIAVTDKYLTLFIFLLFVSFCTLIKW